jgi:hypothetical protein
LFGAYIKGSASTMSFTSFLTERLSSKPTKVSELSIVTEPYRLSKASAIDKFTFDPSSPTSQKTTPIDRRISKVALENAYMSETNVFNAVNKTTQLIMHPKYKLVGSDNSKSFFEEFFDNIGSRGGELEWDELLNSIFKHQLI